MKISEILIENPHLDKDIELDDGLILDGMYLFRMMDPAGAPGSGWLVMHGSPGIDGVVSRGMIESARQIQSAEWPVHVCDGDHD